MKKLALLLWAMMPFFSFADGSSALRNSARTSLTEIIWDVPANRWPSAMWVYKVVPQNFAPPVVSNLMALGSFTMEDSAKLEKKPTFKDERLLFFKNKEKTRHLGISPFLGWVDYKNDSVLAKPKEYPVGVPTEEEAYNLAVDYLRKFGIDLSQLSTKGDSLQLRIYKEEERQGWLDKTKGTNVMTVISRGVDFIRRVDGVNFIGLGVNGGVCFKFGNNGQIAALEIVWKGLEPFELHQTLTAKEMLEFIQSGKGKKWTPPLANQSAIKKITITDVMPFYRGIGGEDEEKFIRPYAVLATSVDYGSSNVTANVECPIIGELAK